jgi:L,D-transpeptidase catalytic domain
VLVHDGAGFSRGAHAWQTFREPRSNAAGLWQLSVAQLSRLREVSGLPLDHLRQIKYEALLAIWGLRMRLKLLTAVVLGALMMLGVAPASAAKVLITISKMSQKMTVTVDGEKKYQWKVSTGAAGYETPSGSHRPFRMEKEHFSKEWDDAPMPHSIFFTSRGHAIHGSYHVKSLGRRASHGCVRLAPENAAKLFSLVSKSGMSNTTVVVKGGLFEDTDELYRPVASLKKKAKDVRKKVAKTKTKNGKKPFWWLAENAE